MLEIYRTDLSTWLRRDQDEPGVRRVSLSSFLLTPLEFMIISLGEK